MEEDWFVDDSVRIASLRRMLAQSDKSISEKKNRLEELKNEEDGVFLEIEYEKLHNNKLREDLEELEGNEIHPESTFDFREPEVAESDGKASISEEYTLRILRDKPSSQGLQIKDIVEEYTLRGLNTYNRVIDAHLKKLLTGGSVYMTNPDNQRGRRYKAI